METYRASLEDDIVESQQYRIRAVLVPKLGNHAKSSDIAVEFINVNKLSEDELKNYEQGIAFIKGIENPYKLKLSKVMSLVQDKLPVSTCLFTQSVGSFLKRDLVKTRSDLRGNIVHLS